MGSFFGDVQSWVASLSRLGRGLIVTPYCRANPPRPERTLELYEFEACPYCRKVREVLSELDLAYICRPCPTGESVKRPYVREHAGKMQFPYLEDPNTDTAMLESEDIITYLVDTYGGGRGVTGKLGSPLNTVSAAATSAIRPVGRVARDGVADREQPPQLIDLFNIEASPYCRKVREALCELNLDHRVHNVAKRSSRRPELIERGGTMMVPYLDDPNTGTAMYESDDIVTYLESTYG